MTAPDPLAWLDALADTHAKATEGPWRLGTHDGPDEGQEVLCAGGSVAETWEPADAAAIVAAHNAMPELIAALRGVLALAEELDREAEATLAKFTPMQALLAPIAQDARAAARHAQYVVDRLRSTVTAALAGPHTTDEERQA